MSRHLLVIGAQRSGTTYLHTLLDAHPEITMARPSRPEPKVFLTDLVSERGREWYVETYFGHATTERLLGEKSTSYIEHPQAAARAAQVLGTPQIVVLLRDPVARAISNWSFSTDHGYETRPLEVALRENLAGSAPWDPEATSVSPFAYLERGRYAAMLAPWYDHFPASTHVFFTSELVSGDETVGELFTALGVEPGFRPPDRGRVVNESRQAAPELSADLVDSLRDYYAPGDDVLRRLLGRELPWHRVAG